ncbi:MAG: potassium channel family protein [Sporichthyaceae bacterium]
MHIVIMGCGRVGSSLALALEAKGHSVAVVDQSSDAFRRLGPGFAGKRVTGIGFERETLIKAGVESADAFAAVSSGDNSNIISARLAREDFGVRNVVARIYDPARAEVYERLGIPTVATVSWTTDQVLRRLLPHGAEPLWRDPSGTIVLARVQLAPSWLGREVRELQNQSGARVAFLTRLGAGYVPAGDSVLQEGDLVHVLVTENDIAAAERIFARGPEGH